MTDTHSHLDGEEFKDDLEDVILRAKETGIAKILVPNVNLDTLPRVIEICNTHKEYLYPMIGLHPEDVKADYISILDRMYDQRDAATFVGVGEVGLDFYWDDTYRKEQIDAYERQICWAVEMRLPLMIHARKAHNELVEIIKRHKNDGLTGVFHCFTGSREMAKDLLQFEGFMLGIGGVLTFKNSKLGEVLRETVPLSRIVLETDSPYMAPVPHRGTRNESAYIKDITCQLADIYGVSNKEISLETDKNANIFSL